MRKCRCAMALYNATESSITCFYPRWSRKNGELRRTSREGDPKVVCRVQCEEEFLLPSWEEIYKSSARVQSLY